jgi:choline dehydrogenase
MPGEQHADTVIVGAGAAGSVIAARMTENSAHDVLLLEAGPDYPPDTRLPADLADGTRNSMRAHDWGYRMVPTARARTVDFPRGRVVGGSSAVNTCIALRGMPYDFEEWAARGLPDWSWERCLPAFLRLEHDLDKQDEHHGQAGPIPIRRHAPAELAPWQAAFMAACDDLGFVANPDANRPDTTGYAPHPMNKVDGVRMSAARGYLTHKVRARAGLRLLPQTHVVRVVFEGRRAVGVEAVVGGTRTVIHAKRVVLAGGAIATPGILLRSGVGPREELSRLGVALVAHVPGVGARLLDHPGVAMFYLPKPGVANTSDPLLQTHLRYSAEGSSRLNDMQLQPGSLLPLPIGDLPALSLMAAVGKPKGHGLIRFPTALAHQKPVIEVRALSHPDDLEQAAEALELAWLLSSTPPLRDLATLLLPPERGLGSRASFREVARRQCGSGYHPCGTVPMGAEDDPLAATDGRGRVRGVKGLLVADASLMPTIPSGNIHLPTLMIGERFGEWLREER